MQAAWLVFSGQGDDTVVLYTVGGAVCLSLSLSVDGWMDFKRSSKGQKFKGRQVGRYL